MENIKFIREIMAHGANKSGREFGNCLYYDLANGNRAKVYVGGGTVWGESHGVIVNIINVNDGKVDSMYFPFANYFKPTQCSENAPKWCQRVVDGRWRFSESYTHVLPKADDFERIASAVCGYMELFSA